jgi:hypothetical protein
LGQTRKTHTGTSFRNACPILQLWHFQSNPCLPFVGRRQETFLNLSMGGRYEPT